MIEMTRHVLITFFNLREWCNFSRIEAVEFSCSYKRVLPATVDVIPVVGNTRTKSIQNIFVEYDIKSNPEILDRR